MDIFVYSDESGVFDVDHNDIFVFGGIILLGKGAKDDCARKYAHSYYWFSYMTIVHAKFNKVCDFDFV